MDQQNDVVTQGQSQELNEQQDETSTQNEPIEQPIAENPPITETIPMIDPLIDQNKDQPTNQDNKTEQSNDPPASNPIYTYSILAKEFILFSLPYLYFIFAALYRIYQLQKLQAVTLQRQSIRSQLSDEDIPKTNPPSLNIKIIISYWLCLVCTVSMTLGFFGLIMTISPKLYFIWLIPIVAHIISVILLKLEFKVQEQQATWTHRIFWPLQTAFLVVRTTQEYQTLLSSGLIILQLFPSLILLIYALYRPNDRTRIPDDTPKFAKQLMKQLEEFKIFQSENNSNRESMLNRTKAKKENTTISKQLSSAFSDLIQSKNQNEQEQFLREKMPERSVSVSKKVIKRFVNDNEILYSYMIITIIEGHTFQSEKRYPEFLNIERVQIDHFNKYNASSFKIHRIDLQLGEDEFSYVLRRREYLERWLQEQLANPTYITKNLLDFLGVDEEMQQPFLIYQQLISKTKSQIRPKSYQKTQEYELQAIRVNSEENLVALDYSELQFSSNCVQYEYGMYGSNSIEFVINIKYKEKSTEHVYRILKTLSCIRQFSEQLELQSGRALPPNLKVTKQILNLTTNEKITFVDEFFRELLGNHEYFSSEFFDFIGFDINNRCPKDQS
ncbi:unnamed protein product [Paramecium pentaurelia]|uniref:PX domain-containing protein n=1 Tax=Paramecium pentaurelia TaxID=43138 RepID=A0A8S1TQI3_9CILI|nr:unnamed protein product [Paramecium pentaurelia]